MFISYLTRISCNIHSITSSISLLTNFQRGRSSNYAQDSCQSLFYQSIKGTTQSPTQITSTPIVSLTIVNMCSQFTIHLVMVFVVVLDLEVTL